MSVLKKLAGETALYGLSSIVGRFINYLLVPLHTWIFGQPRDLSPTVDLFAFVAVANIIYTFGLETGFFRYASKTGDLHKYYDQTLTSVIVLSAVLSLSIVLGAPAIAQAMNYPDKAHIIVWLAVIMFIDAVVAIPFARLRLERQAKRFVKVKIINILANIALNTFFLVFLKGVYEGIIWPEWSSQAALFYNPDWSVEYIFLANLIANLLFIYLLRDLFIDFRFQFDKNLFKELWQYSFPIMILGLVGMVNTMTDRMFLKYLLPEKFYPKRSVEDSLSIYGQCYKLSMLMQLAVQSFKFAADPFFFSNAQDKNAPALLALVMKWFVIVCVGLWVVISLHNDLIGFLFLRSPAYREGLAVVPILSLAHLFIGVYYNLAFWFKLTDRTHFGILISGVGTLVTIGLNFLLIPLMGYMACAWAFLASGVVMCVLCYVLGERYYPVPYRLWSAVGYIGSAGLLIYVSSLIKIPNLWVSVPYHLVLCLLYFMVILLVEFDSLPLVLRQKLAFLRR
ncbi:MAG: lipopolysaccharide biosynthesis protein [Runella sp.]